MEHFRLHLYGRPIELLTDHQAQEPLIKENRSNKTYSARLTRWLDRLGHFDVKIKYIAGKHLGLLDFLSRNPVSKPEPIKHYNEVYVINCILPLFEFIINHGSINESTKQLPEKPKSSEGKANDRSSLVITQEKVSHVNIDKPKEIKLDYKLDEKMCRSLKNLQHIETKSSSAEDDKGD